MPALDLNTMDRRALRQQECVDGRTQHPLGECRRREIPPITYARRNTMDEYATDLALKAIDRDYEVIYDWTTAGLTQNPGHHVYRVKSRGGIPSEDTLVHIVSLQWEMDKPWPGGRPRGPGMWIIEEVKRLRSGSAKENIDAVLNDHDKRQANRARKLAEAQVHHVQEVGKYGKRNVGKVGSRTRRRQAAEKARTPKASVGRKRRSDGKFKKAGDT